jgi:predicted AAA+ superfamily ATPase
MDDPRGFLSQYPDGAILDEVQRVPELFSYLQQVLDEFDGAGMFILTGSNNFLLQENISQSLAGRVGYLFLLPLSLSELDWNSTSSNELLFRGGYPVLHDSSADSSLFFANYIRTYVERDVRLIKNITDLFAFEKFLRLCAGRTGQLLNMSSIAMETGVDVKTIGSWIGVLETSFIAFRLQPYHKNYNKRIVKMPKLYFYDTGLAVALLGIENKDQLATHPFRGNLFENLVILELMKRRFNKALQKKLYFWRDNSGHEIDVILERSAAQLPLEIKSGKTVTDDFFKGLAYWRKLSGADQGFLVYDGETAQERSNGISVIPLSALGNFDL